MVGFTSLASSVLCAPLSVLLNPFDLCTKAFCLILPLFLQWLGGFVDPLAHRTLPHTLTLDPFLGPWRWTPAAGRGFWAKKYTLPLCIHGCWLFSWLTLHMAPCLLIRDISLSSPPPGAKSPVLSLATQSLQVMQVPWMYLLLHQQPLPLEHSLISVLLPLNLNRGKLSYYMQFYSLYNSIGG